MDNFVHLFESDLEFEVSGSYLLYKCELGIYGLWFYRVEEMGIVENYLKNLKEGPLMTSNHVIISNQIDVKEGPLVASNQVDLQKMSNNLLSLLKNQPESSKVTKDLPKTTLTQAKQSVWDWSKYHLSYISSLTFEEFKTILTNVFFPF